jgi:hypothetical protein
MKLDHCLAILISLPRVNCLLCRCPVTERCRGCALGIRRTGGGGQSMEEDEEEVEVDYDSEILLKPSDRLALRLQAPDQVSFSQACYYKKTC